VLSQCPIDDETTPEYRDAWVTTQYLIYHEGGSLSGREWNRSYLNVGSGRFADLTAITGLDSIGDGRGAATVDWDDDGRLDVILRSRTGPRLQFFHNRHAEGGSFVSLELVGGESNRDAIGARVLLDLGDRVLRKAVYAGEGFLSQSSKRLHFGLGDAERIESVTVRWPDGSEEVHRGLHAGARYRIVQGASEPEPVPPRTASGTSPLARVEPRTIEGEPGPVGRIVLYEKLPLAALPVPAFDDAGREVRDLAGTPVLLNLWGSDCASCLREFGEFRERAEEVEDAGLRLVTLTSDPPELREKTLAVLERHGLRTDAGFVDEALLRTFEILFSNLVGKIGGQGGWPMPTSLLLDGAGQLVAVYPGRVDLDRVLADTKLLSRMSTDDLFDTQLQFGFRLTRRERNRGKLARELENAGQGGLAAFFRDLGR